MLCPVSYRELMREHMPDVFLLGAGFSRALSDDMPLLDELSELIRGELSDSTCDGLSITQHIVLDDSSAVGFERALSLLATDQPWLNIEENLRNRALFVEMTNALTRVLGMRQNRALAYPPPNWLIDLVRKWHERRCVVITLNYDTLLEKAYAQAVGDTEHFHYSTTYPHAIMSTASLRASILGGGTSYNDTITLLKLHGSINWLYSGSANYRGETLFHVPMDGAWTPDLLTGPDSLHDRRLDKTPLIIPPTAGKTGYFGNEAVDGLWALASASLKRTERLTIMGYSLPATDTAVVDLLRTSLHPEARWNRNLVVDVVDINEGAADHYRKMIPAVNSQQWMPGTESNPIADFVSRYASDGQDS